MKIENRNLSIPLTNETSTQAIKPGEETSIQDSEDRVSRPSIGIAGARDEFENVAAPRAIIDPIGYPGEEWLWQEESSVLDVSERIELSAELFEMDEAGNLHVASSGL